MENENQKQDPTDLKVPKKVMTVNTYAEDMAKVIEKSEGSIIKKIIHEQEEHEAIKKNISPESSRNKLFMLMSIIFIFVAFLILIFFISTRNKVSSVDVQAQIKPIIFTDKTEYKEIAGLNKNQIIQTILNETLAVKVKSGGIEGVYLTENKKTVGLRRLIALLKWNLVLDKTAFVNDNFLIGVANENKSIANEINEKNGDLFFLLKTRSFLDIFTIFKNWESKMFNDLHLFFGIDLNADTNYLLTKDFEDGIVNNKNARILRDFDGKVVLGYVFADDNSVIITNSDDAVQEVMLRLASGQIKK